MTGTILFGGISSGTMRGGLAAEEQSTPSAAATEPAATESFADETSVPAASETAVSAASESGDEPEKSALPASEEDFGAALLKEKVRYSEQPSYAEYLASKKEYPQAREKLELAAAKDGEEISPEHDLELKAKVKTRGLYAFRIRYSLAAQGMGSCQISIETDGSLPYREAGLLSLRRLYHDASRDYLKETKNQSFPRQEVLEEVQESFLFDERGYVSSPLQIALDEGEHRLKIKVLQDKLKLYSFALVPLEEVASYHEPDEARRVNFETQAEAIEASCASDKETVQRYDAEHRLIVLEAETASRKNDPSLLPQNDRSSSRTTPYDPTYTRMNTIGGLPWKTAGSWLEWTLEVPEEGDYLIGFRFLQNSFRGLPVTRELRVNGKLPFAEARALPFYFAQGFQTKFFADGEGVPYWVHLKKGENRLRLTYVLADLAEIAEQVQRATLKMNAIYRRIMVITGSSPDPYRDYELLLRIPDLKERIKEAKDLLDPVIEKLRSKEGENDLSSSLSRASKQLDSFLSNPEIIAKNIGFLKDNVTALGQWNLDVTVQPLTLDAIYVGGKGSTLPRPEMNFWEATRHELLAFAGSFYNKQGQTFLGTGEAQPESKIEVWVTTGRDQLDAIRRMVGDRFSKEKKIAVELKLVGSDIVLPSTFTGNGPDVVIQAGTTLPMNFAFRGAALDLRQFSDFPEVRSRFSEAAMKSFDYREGTYALPDQMSFPVMFYRKDILAKLNIPLPQTWDDVLSILPFLQANNMEFYLDTATPLSLGSAVSVGNSKAVNSIFLSMLYQAGGSLYNEQGTRTAVTEPLGQEIFRKWTEFYTKHSFPTVVNFLTRFRLGEVPIAVVDFTSYNSLTVGAPEIAGEYSLAMIPGTRDAQGKIRRDLPVTTSAAMIVKPQVEARGNKQAAWEFIKWWTSAETQSNYAAEMEALLGPAARYPVANLESFGKMPWPHEIRSVLEASLSSLREVPQIPGSYITGRDIDNAFYEVINNPRDAIPQESLTKYAMQIDEEILNKLREFRLLPEAELDKLAKEEAEGADVSEAPSASSEAAKTATPTQDATSAEPATSVAAAESRKTDSDAERGATSANTAADGTARSADSSAGSSSGSGRDTEKGVKQS